MWLSLAYSITSTIRSLWLFCPSNISRIGRASVRWPCFLKCWNHCKNISAFIHLLSEAIPRLRWCANYKPAILIHFLSRKNERRGTKLSRIMRRSTHRNQDMYMYVMLRPLSAEASFLQPVIYLSLTKLYNFYGQSRLQSRQYCKFGKLEN